MNNETKILTEVEVAKYMTFPYLLEGGTGERALSTIRQMAGLLEDASEQLRNHGTNIIPNAIDALLARYKGERT